MNDPTEIFRDSSNFFLREMSLADPSLICDPERELFGDACDAACDDAGVDTLSLKTQQSGHVSGPGSPTL